MKAVLIATTFAVTLASAPASAIDGFAVEGGSGNGVDMGRIAAQWDWSQHWFQGRDWHLGGYWDLALGYWDRGRAAPGQHDSLLDIGLTPTFRLEPNGLKGAYADAGVGLHLLSHTTLGDRRFSTAFQFGNHVGIGYRFGVKQAFDLGVRFQHLSNASIKQPNTGINFGQVRLQYHF